ncbi:hypothetical protein CBL_08672 [Carabus blaptoides fortunei]
MQSWLNDSGRLQASSSSSIGHFSDVLTSLIAIFQRRKWRAGRSISVPHNISWRCVSCGFLICSGYRPSSRPTTEPPPTLTIVVKGSEKRMAAWWYKAQFQHPLLTRQGIHSLASKIVCALIRYLVLFIIPFGRLYTTSETMLDHSANLFSSGVSVADATEQYRSNKTKQKTLLGASRATSNFNFRSYSVSVMERPTRVRGVKTPTKMEQRQLSLAAQHINHHADGVPDRDLNLAGIEMLFSRQRVSEHWTTV